MIDQDAISTRFEAAARHLNERGRRMLAASEVRAAGYGGLIAVSQATRMARSTILRGLKELDEPALPPGMVRHPGGGRPALTCKDPTLRNDLKSIIEPAQLGDPMRALLWVSKSAEKIAQALGSMGHKICANTVSNLCQHSQ